MRVVLADVKAPDGWVRKDTAPWGYGLRLRPSSPATRLAAMLQPWEGPSLTLARLAAVLAEAGHEVRWSRGEVADADAALALSSLVDHRNEARWAQAQRARGTRVGFVGLAAAKKPELFEAHADFIVYGEPEQAVRRLAAGERLEGFCRSADWLDLGSLPLPRWDLVGALGRRAAWGRRVAFPVTVALGCPESCVTCPYGGPRRRERPIAGVLDELAALARLQPRPRAALQDPAFTERRERLVALCEGILERGLAVQLECSGRLEDLDEELLDLMQRAGLRLLELPAAPTSPDGRRIPGRGGAQRRRELVRACEARGIRTLGHHLLGTRDDTWDSVAAVVDEAIALGTSLAHFRLLTPYPGTPLWKQLGSRVFEADWQRFDGCAPTFHHPRLSPQELEFLHAAAYARFYLRPSLVTGLWRLDWGWARELARRLDLRVSALHARREVAAMARALES